MKTLRITGAMLAFVLFVSTAANVVAMEEESHVEVPVQNPQQDQPPAAPEVPGRFENGKARVKEAASKVKDAFSNAFSTGATKMRTAGNYAYSNVFAPYGSVSAEAKTAFGEGLAARYPAAADDAGKLAKLKAWFSGKYVDFRKFPYEHTNIGNAVWYSTLAAVATAGSYAAYRLCAYVFAKSKSTPKYVSGKFDAIKNLADVFGSNDEALATLTPAIKAESFIAEIQRNKEFTQLLKKIPGKVANRLVVALDNYARALAGKYELEVAYNELLAALNLANAEGASCWFESCKCRSIN